MIMVRKKTIIFNQVEIIQALEDYFNKAEGRKTERKKITFYKNSIKVINPPANVSGCKIEIEINENG